MSTIDRETAAAVALTFGTATAGDLADLDVPRVRSILLENRVPLATLGLPAEGDVPDWLEKLRFDEIERLHRSVEAYREVADAWGAVGIDGHLIKSAGSYPYTSSNVDVLVDSDRAAEAARILLDLGYVELEDNREPYKRLYRKNRQPHLGFPIHLHTAVAWTNRFVSDQEIMEESRAAEHDGLTFRFPSANHVLLIITAHWLYEDKEVKLRDLYHVGRALQDGVNLDTVRAQARRTGWERPLLFGLELSASIGRELGIPSLAASGRRVRASSFFLDRYAGRLRARGGAFPRPLSKIVSKTLQLAKTGADTQLSARQKAAEIAEVLRSTLSIKAHSLRPAGKSVIVSVSGLDGSGKTTIAKGTQRLLVDEFDFPASYHWIRAGSSPVLEALKTTAEAVAGAPRADTTEARERESVAPRKAFLGRHQRLRAAWGRVVLADFLIRLWGRALAARASGGVHIFDRFSDDAVIDVAADYGLDPSGWLSRLGPHPDLRIVLQVDPEESRRRSLTPALNGYLGVAAPIYEALAHSAHLRLNGLEPIDRLVETSTSAIVSKVVGG
jgi:thymidylate kinase